MNIHTRICICCFSCIYIYICDVHTHASVCTFTGVYIFFICICLRSTCVNTDIYNLHLYLSTYVYIYFHCPRNRADDRSCPLGNSACADSSESSQSAAEREELLGVVPTHQKAGRTGRGSGPQNNCLLTTNNLCFARNRENNQQSINACFCPNPCPCLVPATSLEPWKACSLHGV